jgi:phosphoribosylformylglycinamidine cyclo-ligase
VPPIFAAIEEVGGVHPDEMWRTFNMGIGMAVIVAADSPLVDEAAGLPVYRIGHIGERSGPERVVLH